MLVYTVSEVTKYLKRLITQDHLLADMWISGEVSNLRLSQSGHSFFTIKDSHSQLRCVMFRGATGVELITDGVTITVHGHVSFYETRGSVDLIADIALIEGTGPLALAYEKLKMALEREGLFDQSRKRSLPRFPKVVGVVTSPSGAVFLDICNVLQRRYPLAEIVLCATSVQGKEATQGIVKALQNMNHSTKADVVIVARGGGSLEELWAFNEEPVARAIYASRIPVVSAIGHETDFTISDFVADMRAPTPSAAAELVVPDQQSLKREIYSLREKLYWAVSGNHSKKSEELTISYTKLSSEAPDIESYRRNVDDLSQDIAQQISNRLLVLARRVGEREIELHTLNPTATLKRGYAIVQNSSSTEIVWSTSQINEKDDLQVTVSDGVFQTTAHAPITRDPI